MFHLIENHRQSVMDPGQTGPWFPAHWPLPHINTPTQDCIVTATNNRQPIIKWPSTMTDAATHTSGLGR